MWFYHDDHHDSNYDHRHDYDYDCPRSYLSTLSRTVCIVILKISPADGLRTISGADRMVST